MKKIIAIIVSLVLLMSLVACDPAEPNPSGSTPENPTNTMPTDDIVVNNPTDPEPTESQPAPTEPQPAELAANGVCAVGVVDAAAGTAKILADNGAIAEIVYSCEGDPVPGEIYEFAKNGDVYTLTRFMFINTDLGAWNPRLFDNAAAGTADQLFTHDGTTGRMYDLSEDCVIFVRFSETEWRLFYGSDAIKYSDWPCWLYFNVIPYATEEIIGEAVLSGSVSVILVVGDPAQGLHANEATSFYFDVEGFGWSDGDLIIE